MAEINIPSMFDTRHLMDRQSIQDAQTMAASGDPSRNLMTYNTMRSGDIYNQGLMGLAGLMGGAPDPRIAKQQALEEVFQQFGNPQTPEDAVAIADALQAKGLYNEAMKFMTFANEMRANLPEEEKEPELSTKEKTMEMAEQFHQCAIDAGGWKNSDEACKAAVKKTFIEMQRGTADEAGMIEGAKLNSKAVQETQTKIYLDAGNARDSLYTINQSIDLLDDVYAGSAGEGLSNFKRFMVSIGFAPKQANMSEEQFRRNSMQAVTQWIEKTKGSISDTEMQAFLDASPSLANTKAGNLLILQTMKNWAQFQDDLAVEWNRWKTEADKTARASGIPVSEVDWQTHLHLWYNTGGKKPKAPTAAQIAEASKPDGNDVDQSVEDFKEEYKFTVSGK
jgi:hypothetical protein